MTAVRSDALAILQRHVGRLNGVTAAVLALDLDINERQVRHFVSELRLEGIAICGHPKTGYFIAANGEELEMCCAFLRSRAMHSLVLESRMRKLTLGELLGQLRLHT